LITGSLEENAVAGANGRPLRILHCMWNGWIGGAERAVYLLVREQLRDPSLEPALLYAQPDGPYWERAEELGCPVIGVGVRNGRSISRINEIARAMRGFDVHHFHSAEPLLMLGSLRSGEVRRVYTHRGGITDYPRRKRMQYALTGALLKRSFHGFSGNTRHAGVCAARLFRMDDIGFQVTYNGLEFDLLEPSRSRRDVRAELGLPEQCFVLGTAAHLRSWKRIDRLIRALVQLDDPSVRLLVLGDGPDRPRLEAIANDSGASSRVVFAGPKTDVADYLSAMDAFALPSTGLESFGNAAVEAMSMGLPTIVAADGGGLAEHVDDGVTGFVVGDDQELVERLRELVGDRGRAAEIGAAGRSVVRKRYTPARAARAYRKLYDTACASDVPSGR
jgi:glycosyltransferase involved in cell wall biosynthesis